MTQSTDKMTEKTGAEEYGAESIKVLRGLDAQAADDRPE